MSESKEMYYFEVEPFVHSIMSNQESPARKNIAAKDSKQDEILAKYNVSCADKKLNVMGKSYSKIINNSTSET